MKGTAFVVLLLVALLNGSQGTKHTRTLKKRSLDISSLIKNVLGQINQMVKKIEGQKPCQHVDGPKSLDDRIAVVGGGIAGMHMAYLLKKKGYSNVVVLEKSDRVGGKIMSVDYEGVKHEMGACYCTPDYQDNVYELAYELGMSDDDLIAVPSSTSLLWLDEVPTGPLTFDQFVVWDIMQKTGATSVEAAMYYLVKHSLSYIMLHVKYFGLYPGDLMPRPTDEALKTLNMSLWSFLTQHKLQALHPLLTFSHALQGYGYLDEVSVIYGLMWNTPKLVFDSVMGALTKQFPIKIFRNGFSQIPNKLEPHLNIKKNVAISNIDRSQGNVQIDYEHNGESCSEDFDFLVWAADGREALKVLQEPTEQEKKFNNLMSSWFVTHLVRAYDECKSNVTIKRWLSSLFRKDEYSVMAFRDSKGVLLGRECPLPYGSKANVSGITYQYGAKSPVGSSIVHDNFESHYKDIGVEDKEIIKEQVWEYFGHYNVKDMADGILWDILDNQGQKNTWFIGGTVSHESVKSIINYNKQLVRGLGC